MRCPVCRLNTGHYYWPNASPGEPAQMYSYPLYRHSYSKRSEEFISPRCSECYDKAERRQLMGKRNRERIARIRAGKEEPRVPRKKPTEEEPRVPRKKPAEEEPASERLLDALALLKKK